VKQRVQAHNIMTCGLEAQTPSEVHISYCNTLQMTSATCFAIEYSAADLENDSPISRAEGIRVTTQTMTIRLRHGLEALMRLWASREWRVCQSGGYVDHSVVKVVMSLVILRPGGTNHAGTLNIMTSKIFALYW